MKVLIAGATGAIGRPLTGALVAAGHEVLGLARSDHAAAAVAELGATPVRADAMDRDGLLKAVDGLSADAVIHQLTALSRPRRTVDERDPSTALRKTGTANLLAAAEVLGAGRIVSQSLVTGYGYRDHGLSVLTEDDPFGVRAGSVADHIVDGLVAVEAQTLRADGIALRYGAFYGPGTWFDPSGRWPLPVPAGGGGVMSWIHIADAVRATAAALEHGRPGHAYNIVADEHVTWGKIAADVTAAGGPRRPRLPGWLLRMAVPYLGNLMIDTTLRVSNDKATREFSWYPRHHSQTRERP